MRQRGGRAPLISPALSGPCHLEEPGSHRPALRLHRALPCKRDTVSTVDGPLQSRGPHCVSPTRACLSPQHLCGVSLSLDVSRALAPCSSPLRLKPHLMAPLP